MKSVCIVGHGLNTRSGYGRLAWEVARSLKQTGYEVSFLLHEGKVGPGYKILDLKIDGWYKLLRLPVTIFRVRRYLSDKDIVICYDVNPNALIVSLSTLFQKKKIILHALATYSLPKPKNLIKQLFYKWVYRRADKVVFVSDLVRNLVKQKGIDVHNYSIIPVGVEVNFFTKRDVEKDLENPFIISVGAVKYRKGFHLSVRAFRKIADKYPKLKYLIVGSVQKEDNYFKKLQAYIKEEGLEGRVIWKQNVPDDELIDYYNKSEFFVLCPVTTENMVEGFGIVYLEAGACWKPAVGTLGSGAVAAIVNNETGILAKPNEDDISEAIDKLLSEPNLVQEMGARARKRAVDLSWDNVANLYIREIERI